MTQMGSQRLTSIFRSPHPMLWQEWHFHMHCCWQRCVAAKTVGLWLVLPLGFEFSALILLSYAMPLCTIVLWHVTLLG